MKRIIISPFSKKTHATGKKSPKDYPYWKELMILCHTKNVYTIQIAISDEFNIGADERLNNLRFCELKDLLFECESFISVDNFFHHFAHYYDPNKKGIVIFSQSDPKLFGYDSNINLIKDKKYLRPGKEQYQFWEQASYLPESFVSAEVVFENMCNLLRI